MMGGGHASHLGGKYHVLGEVHDPPVQVVVPVDPEQVAGVGGVAVYAGQAGPDLLGDAGRIGQLGESGQDAALGPEPIDAACVAVGVDHVGGQTEAGGVERSDFERRDVERADTGIGESAHGRRLASSHGLD